MPGSLPFSRNFEIQVVPLGRKPELPVKIRILQPLSRIKARRLSPTKMGTELFKRLITMKRLAATLSRFLDTSRWRGIETAPFGRELELAIIDSEIRPISGYCLRHGDGWFDAETRRPIEVTATHWRSRWPVIFPVSCC